MKVTSIDQVLENVFNRLGGLQQDWLVGDIAKGKNGGSIDIVLVGENID